MRKCSSMNGPTCKPPSDCMYCGYRYGFLEPNYPVPTTIRRVQGCGFADGLFDRDRDGNITWGRYDYPFVDGRFDARMIVS